MVQMTLLESVVVIEWLPLWMANCYGGNRISTLQDQKMNYHGHTALQQYYC